MNCDLVVKYCLGIYMIIYLMMVGFVVDICCDKIGYYVYD